VEFRVFCTCDLDLDPITVIYKFDLYSQQIGLYGMCKCEFPTSRLSKAIVCQTDIQAYRHDQNYRPYITPLCGWSTIQNEGNCMTIVLFMYCSKLYAILKLNEGVMDVLQSSRVACDVTTEQKRAIKMLEHMYSSVFV